jgi:type I restriction enzyme, R subunit
LVGLDRAAAKKAFADFLAAQKPTPTPDQIEFVNMIVDQLTDRGVMEPRLLYESPFTDVNPLGVEGVFGQQGAAAVISIIDSVNRRAAA